jgi:hypothetical protein
VSTPSLGRLLISHITLRGPEIHQLYALIAAHTGISYEDLFIRQVPANPGVCPFGLDDALLREALNFLLVAGLVTQQGESRRKARFHATPLLPGIPFPLLLLRHIRRHSDDRQQAIGLVHRQLIETDTLAVTAPSLRDAVERGPYGRLFAWTGEKITLWTHLAAYLGLIRRLERSTEILIVPQLHLVLAGLQWAAERNTDTCAVDTALKSIEENFFYCFTSRGQVHPGLGQSLVALHRLGKISLTHTSDAAQSVLLGDWRVSELRIQASVEISA